MYCLKWKQLSLYLLSRKRNEFQLAKMSTLPNHRIDQFDFGISDHDTRKSLTEMQKIKFKSDFNREVERLQAWALARGWDPLPVSEFHVSVSDKYRISKALFPAWSGRLGHMEFPARRVAARAAAIAHELTHVFFPNGNRFIRGRIRCLYSGRVWWKSCVSELRPSVT